MSDLSDQLKAMLDFATAPPSDGKPYIRGYRYSDPPAPVPGPAEIKPTPRGPVSGLLADALAGVHNFASNPFGYPNPPGEMLSNALGVPALARTADRISYGEPLTTGSGMTTKPREDTMNALMAAVPVVQGIKAAIPTMRNGLAVAAENALKPSTLNPQMGAIVYHGSPHSFDKFDMGKIGTGEGAQAYGHGLYFADSPGVANSYRETLSDRAFSVGGDTLKGPTTRYAQANPNAGRESMEMPQKMATYALDSMMRAKSADPAGDAIKHLTKYGKGNKDAEAAAGIVRQWQSEGGKVEQGSLYKVDLPDEHIAKMLDWDKPLSQQPEHVINAIKKSGDEDLRNAFFYREFPGSVYEPPSGPFLPRQDVTAGDAIKDLGAGWTPATAAEKLRAQGIPGIKYLDQGSRGAGDGTRNYVLFDDTIPKILERNGQSLGDQLRDKLK